MIKKEHKSKLIAEHAVHKTDTGSAEVQIAILSEEIVKLTKHLKKHAKDNSSRMGLLKMVAKRRKLLKYLEAEFPKRYAKITKKVGLK